MCTYLLYVWVGVVAFDRTVRNTNTGTLWPLTWMWCYSSMQDQLNVNISTDHMLLYLQHGEEHFSVPTGICAFAAVTFTRVYWTASRFSNHVYRYVCKHVGYCQNQLIFSTPFVQCKPHRRWSESACYEGHWSVSVLQLSIFLTFGACFLSQFSGGTY